jgi:uncharacterized low-complexity protein
VHAKDAGMKGGEGNCGGDKTKAAEPKKGAEGNCGGSMA